MESAPLLAPLGSEARKRERVRCSSLIDWPVYPRFEGHYAGVSVSAQFLGMQR